MIESAFFPLKRKPKYLPLFCPQFLKYGQECFRDLFSGCVLISPFCLAFPKHAGSFYAFWLLDKFLLSDITFTFFNLVSSFSFLSSQFNYHFYPPSEFPLHSFPFCSFFTFNKALSLCLSVSTLRL